MSATRSRAQPDFARIASLVGDRARARALTALMRGRALTASELADVAQVSRQTMSAHLGRLLAARLIALEKQGRHRYFRLANAEVAHALETLMGLAWRSLESPVRSGPADPALRRARLCYDHLAGELGVFIYDRLVARGALGFANGELTLSAAGQSLFERFGVDVGALAGGRRILCRACLDWSERRHHLAGALGAAMFARIVELRWARPASGARVVRFSADGERALRKWLA